MKEELSNSTIISAKNLSVSYGSQEAFHEISLDIPRNKIVAIIGPSGCGKSTLIRCFNRMNDLVPSAKVTGEVFYNGQNIYEPNVDAVQVRRQIGMVFQKPNPFPKSIYENISFGARVNNYQGNMDELVEKSLRQAALWDEVKDDLIQKRFGAFRRAAAAVVYRPGSGNRAGSDTDG